MVTVRSRKFPVKFMTSASTRLTGCIGFLTIFKIPSPVLRTCIDDIWPPNIFWNQFNTQIRLSENHTYHTPTSLVNIYPCNNL